MLLDDQRSKRSEFKRAEDAQVFNSEHMSRSLAPYSVVSDNPITKANSRKTDRPESGTSNDEHRRQSTEADTKGDKGVSSHPAGSPSRAGLTLAQRPDSAIAFVGALPVIGNSPVGRSTPP